MESVEDFIKTKGGQQFEKTLTIKGKQLCNFPNWIIADVRFPNEAQAILDRKGILIRVNRYMTSYDWDQQINRKDTIFSIHDPDGWDGSNWGYSWNEEKIDSYTFHSRLLKSTIARTAIKFDVWEKSLFHRSETTLDDYDKFHYIIDNDSSIEELIEKVKKILIKEKLV